MGAHVRLIPATGPQRLLAASNLVFTLGSGLYLTAGVLYFTEAMHLPVAQVGAGFAIAGAVALGLSVGGGYLADRLGARGVYTGMLLVQSAATAAFVLADRFWPFVIVVAVATAAKSAGTAARSPLIRAYGGERPQEFRAFLRSITNVGVSVGAVFAGWAVQVGTSTAYHLMVVGMTLFTVASAVFILLLPAVDPTPVAAGPRWSALRDWPYLLLTGLDGLMAIQFKVLTVALPLWVVQRTDAPHGIISATMVTATLIVVLFQVRASRGIDSPAAGGRAYRRAGAAFLIAAAVLPLSAYLPGWAAAMLLIAAVVVHTIGELWHAAAGFEVSFALAPEHATGQYLGVFGLGAGLAETVGPGLLIGLCITWGTPGWYALGMMFLLTGLAVPVAVRWAAQTGRMSQPVTLYGADPHT
ncbi:MFS transporter [Actinoplanes sp. RD1]|uniref:MFS transporter n=1 Tax=Actinoplanes sp. RD1 TaxID=3064538 RepID=UPI002741FE6F|nr:MFS transporter [Actinoplanes sp. RD1]